MFRSFLKITFRNLSNNKTQSLIKTAGLALALVVSIAIFSWINFELSYDKFNKDAGQIYRIVLDNESVTSPPGIKYLLDKTPGIKYSVRIFNSGFLGEKQKVSYRDKIFTNDKIYYADDNFFDIFSFPFLRGSPEDALKKTNAAVITESTAKKYFGNENPVGKTLLLSNNKELEITGVLKNIPANSHFHFDILITMKALPWWNRVNSIELGSMWIFDTYFKINKKTGIEAVRQKIVREVQPYKYKPESIECQRLTDIHLHSSYERELEANGDIKYIYLFAAIGVLIIIMSCINYINLTTALSANRLKEIGIRKTIGASKWQLISQFTGESIIISFFAFVLALILLESVGPLFLSFIGVNLSPGVFNDPFVLISAFIFTLFIGALTGLFPAIVLVKKGVIKSLKPGLSAEGSKTKSRGMLVIFQFSVSVVLLICSMVIYQQMRYIQNKKLGYNKNQMLVLNMGHFPIVNKIDVLKNSISHNSNVSGITACSQLPTNIKTAEGINTQDGKRYESYYISVDKNFFKTLDIEIEKGSDRIGELTQENNSDMENFKNKFVVNQTLLKKIGVKIGDTDGKTLIIRHGNMKPGPIIGVVKDFNFESLHNPIRPLVFEFTPVKTWGNTYLLVKVKSINIAGTVNYIKRQWDKIADGVPFEYYFLDEEYNALYKSETQTGNLFFLFTAVSIFIIVLGLLGLIAFITARRTKEIGVRKVLGASTLNIVLLLSRKFIAWAVIANLIAWPAAYYFMNKWLEDFAYRINLNLWIFVSAGFIVLLIALTTVSFRAVKAATANPVESLRYE